MKSNRKVLLGVFSVAPFFVMTTTRSRLRWNQSQVGSASVKWKDALLTADEVSRLLFDVGNGSRDAGPDLNFIRSLVVRSSPDRPMNSGDGSRGNEYSQVISRSIYIANEGCFSPRVQVQADGNHRLLSMIKM